MNTKIGTFMNIHAFSAEDMYMHKDSLTGKLFVRKPFCAIKDMMGIKLLKYTV